tara:strand:- start:11798 stop:12520 length:723 start_codon:yes stop_codon:yes gene_type:complete
MFEDYFKSFVEFGVIGSAMRGERSQDILFELIPVSIPKFCDKGFKGVDDSPFGGGTGMVMRPDVLKNALVEGVVKAGGYHQENFMDELHIIAPGPRGKTWDQPQAKEFAKTYLSCNSTKDLVFICGRYEGIDERFLQRYVHQHISIGNFILTGGELAVMTILDSSLRFAPEVLGNKQSALNESFFNNSLEHALYTRPRVFEGLEVPDALKSGHHKKIADFQKQSAKELTESFRKDLKQDE